MCPVRICVVVNKRKLGPRVPMGLSASKYVYSMWELLSGEQYTLLLVDIPRSPLSAGLDVSVDNPISKRPHYVIFVETTEFVFVDAALAALLCGICVVQGELATYFMFARARHSGGGRRVLSFCAGFMRLSPFPRLHARTIRSVFAYPPGGFLSTRRLISGDRSPLEIEGIKLNILTTSWGELVEKSSSDPRGSLGISHPVRWHCGGTLIPTKPWLIVAVVVGAKRVPEEIAYPVKKKNTTRHCCRQTVPVSVSLRRSALRSDRMFSSVVCSSLVFMWTSTSPTLRVAAPPTPPRPGACQVSCGTALAERLTCSPPAKANRVHSTAWSLPYFRNWESCRTMPLVSPVSPVLAFWRCSILTSSTLKTSIPECLLTHASSPQSRRSVPLLTAHKLSDALSQVAAVVLRRFGIAQLSLKAGSTIHHLRWRLSPTDHGIVVKQEVYRSSQPNASQPIAMQRIALLWNQLKVTRDAKLTAPNHFSLRGAHGQRGASCDKFIGVCGGVLYDRPLASSNVTNLTSSSRLLFTRRKHRAAHATLVSSGGLVARWLVGSLYVVAAARVPSVQGNVVTGRLPLQVADAQSSHAPAYKAPRTLPAVKSKFLRWPEKPHLLPTWSLFELSISIVLNVFSLTHPVHSPANQSHSSLHTISPTHSRRSLQSSLAAPESPNCRLGGMLTTYWVNYSETSVRRCTKLCSRLSDSKITRHALRVNGDGALTVRSNVALILLSLPCFSASQTTLSAVFLHLCFDGVRYCSNRYRNVPQCRLGRYVGKAQPGGSALRADCAPRYPGSQPHRCFRRNCCCSLQTDPTSIQFMSRQSQCSTVLQAPSRTVGFTRRFHTLSSIQATNTSLAVVPQSLVVVHTSLRSRSLARRPPSKTAGRWVAALYIGLRPPTRIFPNSRDASRRAEALASLTRTFLRRR
ncbi:hypothetical protein PR048_021514 [Dryococelus australis]|uniref:Uncharacterized protein n=1 Tax=Dryococelus australis TaxID=614101 RepID=A0ABQ9GYH7_9NEOP|nr:hypothetical protein PR048_021514 [Dryococelus australis]